MRFKKQIIIICLLTFMFLPFGSTKKVSANPLAIPLIEKVVLVVGALVTSGMVIRGTNELVGVIDEVVPYLSDSYFSTDPMGKTVLNLKDGLLNNISEHLEILEGYKNYVPMYEIPVKAGQVVLSNPYGSSFKKTSHVHGRFGLARTSVMTFRYASSYDPYTEGYKESKLTLEPGSYGISCGYYSGNALHLIKFNDNGGFHSVTKLINMNTTMFLDYWYELSCDGYANVLSDGNVSVDWSRFNPTITDDVLSGSSSITLNPDIVDSLEVGVLPQFEFPLTKENIGDVITVPVIDENVGFVPDVAIPDKPAIGETEAPTTENTLWDTLFGWLKDLFKPLTDLLGGLWDLIKSLLEMLKGLLTSILDLIKSLVQSLIDGIVALFVPSVAFEDIFKDAQKNFIGQIVDFFDFSTLWNIEPKPLEFNIKMPFYDFAKGERVPYEFDIKFFENKFMKENINLIRNVITYPILITTVYFIILHFMPKRDID